MLPEAVLFTSFFLFTPSKDFIVGNNNTSLIASAICQKHHKTVDSVSDSTCWRHTDFKCVEGSPRLCALPRHRLLLRWHPCAAKRSRWSIGSLSSEYALHISHVLQNSSKRSTFVGSLGFFLVRGDISIG